MATIGSKLEKMAIQVFKDRARKQRIDTFKVMFNPTSFSMSYSSDFSKQETIDTDGQKASYFRSPPANLSLSLIFDGTGVADIGSSPGGSVSQRVEAFLRSTVYMNGSIHEPNYLRLQWGDSVLSNFDCRLTTVSVQYKSFDKSGAPIRAELSTSFVEDLDDPKRVRLNGKSSPDLSHTRIVRSGDTLPLLCKEIYGTPEHYIRVAQANGLDDFRNLTPGTEILFPPLAK